MVILPFLYLNLHKAYYRLFPDDKSIQKIVFLALKNAAKKWTMPLKDWPLALNQFEILCGDFKYDLIENKK